MVGARAGKRVNKFYEFSKIKIHFLRKRNFLGNEVKTNRPQGVHYTEEFWLVGILKVQEEILDIEAIKILVVSKPEPPEPPQSNGAGPLSR